MSNFIHPTGAVVSYDDACFISKASKAFVDVRTGKIVPASEGNKDELRLRGFVSPKEYVEMLLEDIERVAPEGGYVIEAGTVFSNGCVVEKEIRLLDEAYENLVGNLVEEPYKMPGEADVDVTETYIDAGLPENGTRTRLAALDEKRLLTAEAILDKDKWEKSKCIVVGDAIYTKDDLERYSKELKETRGEDDEGVLFIEKGGYDRITFGGMFSEGFEFPRELPDEEASALVEKYGKYESYVKYAVGEEIHLTPEEKKAVVSLSVNFSHFAPLDELLLEMEEKMKGESVPCYINKDNGTTIVDERGVIGRGGTDLLFDIGEIESGEYACALSGHVERENTQEVISEFGYVPAFEFAAKLRELERCDVDKDAGKDGKEEKTRGDEDYPGR